MNRTCHVLLAIITLIGPAAPTFAQGNTDWDIIWQVMQPLTPNDPIYGWMAGQRQYTGLAYDKWRDVVYIVNPAYCGTPISTPCPRIHIWDALTGLPSTTVGRGASGVSGVLPGQAGQLAVPPDTIVSGYGWPSAYGGFSQGQYPVYKIDLDDEGRIFACNLVSPIWGICFPGPPPNCLPEYLAQGPFRIYRWNTPWATPKRVYATLNGAQSAIGTGIDNPPDAHQLSEMTYYRWGDAFDVVGGRTYVQTPNGPTLYDSVRIFTSGGAASGQSTVNNEINVILADTRTSPRIPDGLGRELDYRVGVRLTSSLQGLASHGIAATGPSSVNEIWHDANTRVTTMNNQGQTVAPLPQNIAMTHMWSLSSDEISGTGYSGALAFINVPGINTKLLVCADGLPSNVNDPTQPNTRTSARVINVTTAGQEARQPGMGNTPPLGSKILNNNSGSDNWIADVDFKLEGDPLGRGFYVTLFVLMSNNGIAAYHSKTPILPVELSTLTAVAVDGNVILDWEVTGELNNAGFEIQRSYNGTTFEAIGFVAGRGTDMTPKRYRFADPILPVFSSLGTVYYRLRQVDSDGRADLSPIVTVYFGAAADGIALSQNYPNPVHAGDGATTIAYQLPAPGHVTLVVYNALGEELATLVNTAQSSGSYSVPFATGTLPAGTYIYKLNVDGAMTQRCMVVY
jgi:hypothetical protein